MSEEVLSFGIEEIMEMIPHRYPFLLIDKITECVPGKYAKGYKNLTFNEEFFQGHFPNKPIMPGVLQLEAIAQMGAGIIMTLPEYKGKLVVYAGIDGARFKAMVKPGDRFDIHVELVKIKGPIIKAHGKAFVGDKLAVEADMLFSVV
ncbi:3-hydroxyacyl-ACP dehydratase FabZ [bacterium]|nr:3-hydroxyacyl-ACP dehydratase FabZ [bacterium]